MIKAYDADDLTLDPMSGSFYRMHKARPYLSCALVVELVGAAMTSLVDAMEEGRLTEEQIEAAAAGADLTNIVAIVRKLKFHN